LKITFSVVVVSIIVLCNAVYSFDHSYIQLDELLKTKVVDGMVDYKSIKADPSVLTIFLNEVNSISKNEFDSWSEDQQLSMLINLYNAATIKLIIDYYPVKSIKKIGGIFKGPWKQRLVGLFGESITLNHLEHDIIRKRFTEPRIHFALVCAAKGCPVLRSQAYLPKKLDMQLAEQAKVFIAESPQKNRFEPDINTLFLSPIFKWYKVDFEKEAGGLINYLQLYLPKISIDVKIRYTDYDWSLNSQ
jgi:hypothetical protein